MKKIILMLLMIPNICLANQISTGSIVYPAVKITHGTATSAAINTNGMQLVGCQIPGDFTGTSVSFTGSTSYPAIYVPLFANGISTSYPAAPGRYISFDPSLFSGVQFLKIISGSTESSDRTLSCAMKGM